MLEMPPSVQTVVESYLTLSSRCGSNTGRHKGMGDASVTRPSSQATPTPGTDTPQPHVEMAQGLQTARGGKLLRISNVGIRWPGTCESGPIVVVTPEPSHKPCNVGPTA